MSDVSDPRATYFADALRASAATIQRQHAIVTSSPLVAALLDSFPEAAAILNGDRQIVLANDKMARLTGVPVEALVGRRVGEAIGCEYSHGAPNGCGTTRACEHCGAVKAMLHTQSTGLPARETCRLTLSPERGQDSMDFGVWTTPVEVEGERFTVFAVKDTSDEQRRRLLERIFFHDLLNSAGSLQQLLQLLPLMSPQQAAALTENASHLASQVVEEIQAQRDLAAAERGELEPLAACVDVRALLDELIVVYRHNSAARGKLIVVDAGSSPTNLRTDPRLLRRVLSNLLKNALEASRNGEQVTVTCRAEGEAIFEVHNAGVMTEAVKLQVFRRSFTTKQGLGRGVGTYSARLLTQRYLGGRVTFTSEEGQGTTFRVALPNGEGGRQPNVE